MDYKKTYQELEVELTRIDPTHTGCAELIVTLRKTIETAYAAHFLSSRQFRFLTDDLAQIRSKCK